MAPGLTQDGRHGAPRRAGIPRRSRRPPGTGRTRGVRRRRARRDDRSQGLRRRRADRARHHLPDRLADQADRRRRGHGAHRGRFDVARGSGGAMAAGARRAPGPPQPRVGARRHRAGRAADHRRRRPVVPPRVGLGDGAARQLPDPARRVRARPPHVLAAVAAVGSHARRVDRPARQPAAARPARVPVALCRRRPGCRRAHRAGGGSTDRRRAARPGVRAARHGRHRLLRPCRASGTASRPSTRPTRRAASSRSSTGPTAGGRRRRRCPTRTAGWSPRSTTCGRSRRCWPPTAATCCRPSRYA